MHVWCIHTCNDTHPHICTEELEVDELKKGVARAAKATVGDTQTAKLHERLKQRVKTWMDERERELDRAAARDR